MTAPDESTRRKLDAEQRLQADPVLRECVDALAELVRMDDHDFAGISVRASEWIEAIAAARAALARARGES